MNKRNIELKYKLKIIKQYKQYLNSMDVGWFNKLNKWFNAKRYLSQKQGSTVDRLFETALKNSSEPSEELRKRSVSELEATMIRGTNLINETSEFDNKLKEIRNEIK